MPNRKASIYTSSHFYLDDYPNAPEPISDAPRPHTTINPAAAFETADEGYSGTPFPRPPRDFTRPSFLPDSDDGGMDPGQALRNDGLNPPRPPTLGGRLRESGIQAAETITGRSCSKRRREPDLQHPEKRRRLAGPHAADSEEAAGTGAAARRGASATDNRQAFRSGAPARASRPKSCGGGAPGRSRHRSFCIAAAGRSRSLRRLCHGGGGCGSRGGSGNSGGSGWRSFGIAR